MIIRVLAGLVIGWAYGFLVGVLTSLLWHATHDPAYPGPMIPNNNEWGRIIAFFATLIAGSCGALVGALVTTTTANKKRGGIIGLGVGLVVFVFFSYGSIRSLVTMSTREWQTNLVSMVAHFLFLPIGLGLTGIVVSLVANRSNTEAAH